MAPCCPMAHGGWVLVLVLVLVKEEEQDAEGLEAMFGSPRMDPGGICERFSRVAGFRSGAESGFERSGLVVIGGEVVEGVEASECRICAQGPQGKLIAKLWIDLRPSA